VPRLRRSRISLPVLKNGASFSVTGTLSPVRGLRPVRQRVRDLAENGVDDGLDVALIEMRIAGGHALHEFRLNH
jgi:hypothetical protein